MPPHETFVLWHGMQQGSLSAANAVQGTYWYAAGLDAEEGTPADEADVELKSNASESAIWRLTAGKGDMGLEGAGPVRMSGSMGSGEWSGGVKAREPTSERRTAAGRIDFVLQVRSPSVVMSWGCPTCPPAAYVCS